MAFKPSWATFSALKPQFNSTGAAPYTTTQSALLNGVDEYIDFGNVNDITGAQATSWTAWCKSDASDNLGTICMKGQGPGGGLVYFFMQFQGRQLVVQMNDGSSSLNAVTQVNSVPSQTWFLCTVAYGGSKASGDIDIYFDTTLQSLATDSGSFAGSLTNTDAFEIGRRKNGSGYLDGNIKDVCQYDGIKLGSSDVTEIYNGGSPLNMATITNAPDFWVRFETAVGDDITGTTGTIFDQIGSSNGTPQNTEGDEIVNDSP